MSNWIGEWEWWKKGNYWWGASIVLDTTVQSPTVDELVKAIGYIESKLVMVKVPRTVVEQIYANRQD
jgi:hypothetical protein